MAFNPHKPPGYLGKANYIVWNVTNPCHAPWFVYLETAAPAALTLAINLVCFDLTDVIGWLERPRGTRAGRHGRRGEKGSRGRKPQGIAERIRRKIPALVEHRNRKVSNGVRHLWAIYDLEQRFMWQWLVFSSTVDFFYDWTSLLYKTEYCQQALQPGAVLATGDSGVYTGLPGWQPLAAPDIAYVEGTVAYSSGAFTIDAGVWWASGGVNLHNSSASDVEVSLRVSWTNFAGSFVSDSDSVVLPPGGSGGLVVQATFRGPGSGAVQIRVTAGFVDEVDSLISLQGQPPSVPPPTKYNCFGLTGS